jgi:glyoxylase-like metal-dependent hydrolase (beta-lactamase superfamily II)
LKLGNPEAALKDADLCVGMRPEWNKSHFRRGEALLELRRTEDASRAFETALGIEPKDKKVAQRKFYADTVVACSKAGVSVVSLIAGKGDFCHASFNPISKLIGQFAVSLANFIHIIADARTKEAVVIDPCWDTDGITRTLKKHGWALVGIVLTHAHFDHCGGKPPPPFDSYGIRVPGVSTLLKKHPTLKCYINAEDMPQLLDHNPELASQRSRFSLTSHSSPLDLLPRLHGTFIHTPGHTPGSQALLLKPSGAPPLLFSGDLLFPGSCGRMDFPESDPEVLFATLETGLDSLGDETAIFPGHDYGGALMKLVWERETGCVGKEGVVRLKRNLEEEAAMMEAEMANGMRR